MDSLKEKSIVFEYDLNLKYEEISMRNKIYITNNAPLSQQEQCCLIDVGIVLANAYTEKPDEFKSKSKFDSFTYFRRIIEKNITESITRIVFFNIGILLEKEFALDVSKFFLEFAKDYQVFLLWTGKIENNSTLIWNVEKPNNKIEFNQGVIEVLNE